MEAKLCQSCGMPLSSAEYSEPMPTVASTRNIAPIAISTVILHRLYYGRNDRTLCTVHRRIQQDSGMNFTKEEAIAGMKEFFPTLKRWQSKQ